ncbi:DUF2788 domain-containing protein [Hydromonas duriensis]|uniref:Uncharacterized protein DUF2788 n=1 Tax=Hydromonas duriensis TaxID=1527608 RepID=A0A4R6Y825_9BURK|nr:DUF2788 domain-containing protein [Hydromonas duriensis]TDR31526.1 uncharacterized protein DUF2788 [Hydromonas duriensis]
MTEAQFSEYGFFIGVGGLCALMVFIVFKLAKDSKAGRFGTIILLVGLVMGVVGFLVKGILSLLLEK